MKKTWLICFLVIVVIISGCAGPKPVPQPATTGDIKGTTVDIKDFAFDPATVTIAKGTMVTWIQKDSAQHTVTEINNVFSSDTLSQGQTFSYTFNEAGTFEYSCHIHPSMRGKVIVT
ncbi:MAG: cupredoxin family copper-binding protein [Candidatus Methanoperedens sp.]